MGKPITVNSGSIFPSCSLDPNLVLVVRFQILYIFTTPNLPGCPSLDSNNLFYVSALNVNRDSRSLNHLFWCQIPQHINQPTQKSSWTPHMLTLDCDLRSDGQYQDTSAVDVR